jgi:hypothetical protein
MKKSGRGYCSSASAPVAESLIGTSGTIGWGKRKRVVQKETAGRGWAPLRFSRWGRLLHVGSECSILDHILGHEAVPLNRRRDGTQKGRSVPLWSGAIHNGARMRAWALLVLCPKMSCDYSYLDHVFSNGIVVAVYPTIVLFNCLRAASEQERGESVLVSRSNCRMNR